jgi:DNA-binding LytR/AlgR family response regulator
MKRAFSGSVLVVEDSPTRIDWFRERVPHAVIASTPLQAVEALTYEPETVFLDFDLGAANSLGVAQLLADAPPKLCVIHSANEKGAAALKSLLPAALVLPFASFTIEGDEIFWKTF